jgi:hypothetical protein
MIKKSTPYLILFFLFFLQFNLVAQQPVFSWAKHITSTVNYSYPEEISIDAGGNVYTIGNYTGSIDLDASGGSASYFTYGQAIFISKLNTNGSYVWGKTIKGVGFTASDAATAIDFIVDNNGNSYITGSFRGDIDCDPGAGVFAMSSSYSNVNSMFMIKLDVNGNFVWAKKFETSFSNSVSSYSISLDPTGNVLLSGIYVGTIDFDPSFAINSLASGASSAGFILKMNSLGNFVWVKDFKGSGQLDCYKVTSDALGNIYSTGLLRGTYDFNPSAGVFNLSNVTDGAAFVLKLDATGDFSWVKKLEGTTVPIAKVNGIDIKVDANFNVFTVGQYNSVSDFDPGVAVFNLTIPVVPSSNLYNTYISKLDVNGNFVWAKSLAGSTSNWPYSLALDAVSNVFVTGIFNTNIDFDPSIATDYVSSVGGCDAYILKLTSAGNYLWGKSVGSTGIDFGACISVNNSGQIAACGVYANTTDFDPGSGVFNRTPSSTTISDDYILKWVECPYPVMPTSTTPAANLSVCFNAPNTLSATGGAGTLYWYATPTGGVQLGFGNTFSVSPQSTNYTLYVADSTCHGSSARLPIQVIVRANVLAAYPTATPNIVCQGSPTHLTYAAPSCGLSNNFEFSYAPSNWTTTQVPLSSTGTINTSNAPTSISMISSNNNSGLASSTFYSIVMPCTGNVTFNWSYSTVDGPNYDKPRYKINAGLPVFFTGFSILGANVQSGSVTLSLNSGDVLYLEAYSDDNQFGSCTTVITNFTANSYLNQYTKWYDAAIGGNYLGGNYDIYTSPNSPGLKTYYAEVYDMYSNCSSPLRAPVEVLVNPAPASSVATASPNIACLGSSVNVSYPSLTCGTAVGFQHAFAPANWSTVQSPLSSNGSIVTSYAPFSISLISSNNLGGTPSSTNYSILMPCSGVITFNWSYTTVDGAQYDYPQYKINGGTPIIFPGFATSGPSFQTGTASVVINAGETFSFMAQSADNLSGSCSIYINDFKAPTNIAQSVKWYNAPTAGIQLGSTNNLSITPAAAGIYTYYAAIKNSNTGCETTTRTPTNTSAIEALPVINITPAGNQTICAGSLITLAAAGANTYSWSPIGFVGNTITILPTATTMYNVTGTSSNGCVNTSTKLVTVLPLPNVTATATPVTIACGASATLTGSGALNYNWQPGNYNAPVATVFPGSTTVYTLTGVDANGCAKSITKTINVTGACNSVLNLKLFIQGFYAGGGMMVPALLNQSVAGALASKTDSVWVELRTPNSPYVLEASKKVLLNTNGTVTCTFNNFSGGTYYIVIKHRNGIETWSKNPVPINWIASTYNFTSSSTKAFGDNQIEVESGVWAIYNGDIDQNGSVDNSDFSEWEADANNFVVGYVDTDLDGNGSVDNGDFSIWEANANGFISTVKP